MSVGDIVRVVADDETDAVRFKMTYSGHVHGFTMTFPQDSPFYRFAAVSVGEVTDDSVKLPKVASIPLAQDVHGRIATNKAPVPYMLKGLLPLGPTQNLALRRQTDKPIPDRGFHVKVAAVRNVPTENWSSVFAKEQAYAFTDIVGDLPFLASYQTPEALIAALYTSMRHAIQADPYNSQHGCTPEDLLSVKYDESTCRYVFECGPRGARIELTLQQNLAALFGVADPRAEHTTLRFASVPKRADAGDPSDEDRRWARLGHPLMPAHNLHDGATLPVAVESAFPVTPSLGTENIYVKTDIISDASSIHDGARGNVLAVVPVNWAEESASVHQPVTQVGMPVNASDGTIRSINIKIHDSHGDNIRFMSHDNLPVTVTLRLHKVGRAAAA
jgi:hypothetical protein